MARFTREVDVLLTITESWAITQAARAEEALPSSFIRSRIALALNSNFEPDPSLRLGDGVRAEHFHMNFSPDLWRRTKAAAMRLKILPSHFIRAIAVKAGRDFIVGRAKRARSSEASK